jgi:hypothetical protein
MLSHVLFDIFVYHGRPPANGQGPRKRGAVAEVLNMTGNADSPSLARATSIARFVINLDP